MTSSLIKYLLSDSGSAQHLIISLMNHFDLLCQYAGFEALQKADDSQDFLYLDGSEEGTRFDDILADDNCDYFIPCLLHERASPLESQKMKSNLKTIPLLLSSSPLRIPRALFYRVLTHLCKRFPRLPVLYSNVGYFRVYHGHTLEFSLNRDSFQFVVFSETERPPRSTVCCHARDYLVDAVEKLKMEGMAGLELEMGFCVSDTGVPIAGIPDNDFVSLDGFPEQRIQLYSRHTKRQVDCPPELLKWYPQLRQKRNFQFTYPDTLLQSELETKRVSYMTAVEDLIGDDPSQCIVDISRVLDQPDKMGDNWRRLWSKLLTRPVEEEVASQAEEGPTRFLLSLWCREKPPHQATVKHLIQALNSIYRNDVARTLENTARWE
jgi:hypothetical protein